MEELTRKTDGTVRVGVYICHCGGNISDVVDVKKVAEKLSRIPGVVIARTSMFMCSDVGQGLIAEDIKNGLVDRVVVASCSPRLHGLTFRNALTRSGMNPYLYEHANVREQVSWVTHANPVSATEKAADLVAIAVAKARLLEPLQPIRVEAYHHAVVVGGGISGLKAALDISRQGIGVTLLEKTPFIGGHVAQLGTLFPTGSKARDVLSGLISNVLNQPNLEIITGAEIKGVSGNIGDFHLKVKQLPRGVAGPLKNEEKILSACPEKTLNKFDYGITSRKAIYKPYENCYPSIPAIDWQVCTRCGKCLEAEGGSSINLDRQDAEFDVRAGMILIATGFEHYEPAPGEYGYGIFPEVVTLPQLIRVLDSIPEGDRKLVWKGREINSIAMIHCVGSRHIEGVHQPKEGGKLNQYCSRVCCTAALQAGRELTGRFSGLNIFDFYRDIRTYGRGHENYYEDAAGTLFFRFIPENPPVVERNNDGEHPLIVKVNDQLTYNTEIEVPIDMVVLSVGMEPQDTRNIVEMVKLPVGLDGFFQEVHPKLRPVESSVGGVLLAGTCQGPKDITESCNAASAAAVKAAVALSRDYIELDPYVAVVDVEKCTGCGLCLPECAYQDTITLKEVALAGGSSAKKAVISPSRCKGCGACVAVCEPRAIKINGWTLDQFDAMVNSLAGKD